MSLISLSLLGARWALACVFVLAAVVKLGRPGEFAESLMRYPLLRARLVVPVAVALPWLELSLGVALAVGLEVAIAALSSAGLLLAFTAAMSVSLARGRTFDCGCGLRSGPSELSWRLVLRNVVLAATAVAIAAGPSGDLAASAGWAPTRTHLGAATSVIAVPLCVLLGLACLRLAELVHHDHLLPDRPATRRSRRLAALGQRAS